MELQILRGTKDQCKQDGVSEAVWASILIYFSWKAAKAKSGLQTIQMILI